MYAVALGKGVNSVCCVRVGVGGGGAGGGGGGGGGVGGGCAIPLTLGKKDQQSLKLPVCVAPSRRTLRGVLSGGRGGGGGGGGGGGAVLGGREEVMAEGVP